MYLVSKKLVENCKCETVDYSEIKSVIECAENMNDIMIKNNGIGLAAPQVGIFKRFFIMKDFQTNSYLLIINPIITWKSNKLESFEEGCLTYNTASKKPTIFIKRSKSIIASYTYPDGSTVTKNMKRLTAKLFQHESDHLIGITIFNKEGN